MMLEMQVWKGNPFLDQNRQIIISDDNIPTWFKSPLDGCINRFTPFIYESNLGRYTSDGSTNPQYIFV